MIEYGKNHIPKEIYPHSGLHISLLADGKYHILKEIYPHSGLHISLLADGNIHNIKLIYRYISNNDHPVKTLLSFCGVYHGNIPDIKGNPPYNI